MDNGRTRRPDCHEQWTFEYGTVRNVQRLDRLIALCMDCHRVQHIGLANVNGEMDLVIAKLCAVNSWTEQQADRELDRAEEEFVRRAELYWDLDCQFLATR